MPSSLSQHDLAALSVRLGKEWQLLGISLGFSQAQLEQLQQAFPRDVATCIFKMLHEWQKRAETFEGVHSTSLLVSALQDVGQCDIAEELRSKERQAIEGDGYDEVDSITPRDTLEELSQSLSAIRFHGDSSSDLQRLTAQTRRSIEQWQDEQNVFVETSACQAAWTLLSQNRYLTLTGNPGDGKTTVAKYVLSKVATKGFEVAIVTDPLVIERCFDPEKKLTVFVDDAFGTPTMNNNLVETWVRLHDKLQGFIDTENFCIVLATRKQVLLACTELLETCDCYTDTVLDLTSEQNQLTSEEKQNILQAYCTRKEVPVSNQLLDKSRLCQLSGFPLICKLYAADPTLQGIGDYFEKPLAVLHHQIQVLSQSDKPAFCGLVLILMHDGVLKKRVLDVFQMNSDDKLKVAMIKEACGLDATLSVATIGEALLPLVGVYTAENEDTFMFIHDAIFDTVTLVFGEKYPQKVLSICSPQFLHRRVRIEAQGIGSAQSLPRKTDVLLVPRKYYKDLAVRFLRDIVDRNMSTAFDNPSIENKQIQRLLVKEIKQFSDEKLKQFFKLRDRSIRRDVLWFTCHYRLTHVMEGLLEIYRDTLNTNLLIEAIERNAMDIMDLLLKHGVDVNAESTEYGRCPIHVAARQRDFGALQKLIAAGADAHAKDTSECQAIHFVCEKGDVKSLKMLLDLKADPKALDAFRRQPIHCASSGGLVEKLRLPGHIDCVEVLLEQGVDPTAQDSLNFQPIHFASELNDPSLVNLLLDRGADVDSVNDEGKTPLHYACRWGRMETASCLIERGANLNIPDSRGQRPLHLAVEAGLDCVQLLLQTGSVDVDAQDKNGMTPLHCACRRRTDKGFETMKALFDTGADVHKVDLFNMHALHFACDSNSTETAKYLIERGLDIHAKGFNNRQPIHFSVAEGNVELTALLVERGADINAKSKNAMKPIHYACKHNSILSLKQLIKYGADVNERDYAQYTPLFYACLHGLVGIVHVLMEHGADPTCRDYLDRSPLDMIPIWSSKEKEIREMLTNQASPD